MWKIDTYRNPITMDNDKSSVKEFGRIRYHIFKYCYIMNATRTSFLNISMLISMSLSYIPLRYMVTHIHIRVKSCELDLI